MKMALLISMFFLGIIFNAAFIFAFLIQYLIMIMLFLAFLEIEITKKIFNMNVILILFANILLPFILYLLITPFDNRLAITAFVTAISPTATAAPVITSYLKGRVEYVVGSVLLTNCAVAILLPFILPVIIRDEVTMDLSNMIYSIVFVIFLPLLVAQALRKTISNLKRFIKYYREISFFVWLAVIFIATAKSANFIMEKAVYYKGTIIIVAFISLAICIINFYLGKKIGGKYFGQEASQSLGQKNTMFTIWVSLTFINPLVAFGPMFYILFHNLYNSYQIYSYTKKVR